VDKGTTRFLKYSLVGFSTFAVDLFLLYVLTDFFLLPYLLSTGLAFLIAVSANYYVSRRLVFSQTTRKITHGYYAFIIIAGVGLILVISLMALFVELFDWNYLISRVVIAGVVGIWNYAMNLFVNFKVVGKH
jgi:putative flippase GtrA